MNKKAFPLWEQTGLKCTASIKECLKAVIVLETRGETEKEKEEEEEKGGDVRLRVTFMGLLGLCPFTFLLIFVTFDFTVIGACPSVKCLKYESL